MKRHEIPTHLDAPDRFLFGLTAKQAMQLMAAAAGTYGTLDNPVLPVEAKLPLAVVGALLGLALALIRPGGRALEEWLVLLACHVASPRQMVWRPCPVFDDDTTPRWRSLTPRVGWTEPARGEEHDHVAVP